ncbi:hypothetical protein [Streptomyces tubercidicus]|uniref:hypothetical protein n=1 Tax=Streptomyces tubercidicus TaxID=47759 RepID=UPI0036CA1B5E
MAHTYRLVSMVTIHPADSGTVSLTAPWVCGITWRDALENVQAMRDHHLKFSNEADETSSRFYKDDAGSPIAFKYVWSFATTMGIRCTDAIWIVRER